MSIWPTESGDGSVSSEDRWRKMAKYWLPSGVLQGYLSELSPSLAGGVSTVSPGACWLDGHYAEIVASDPVSAAGDGLLVAQYVKASQSAALVFNAGASTPTQTDATYELPIASVVGGVL